MKYIYIFLPLNDSGVVQVEDILPQTRYRLSHVVVTIDADALATRGAKASAAMILT